MGTIKVEVRVLGAFAVTCDGELVDQWPSRRSAELVQLLAIAPEHRLVRDQVIEALWPHLTADAGAANLRKAAFHVRQAVSDQAALVLRGGQVSLFPDAHLHCDLDDFLTAARDAIDARDPALADRAAARYGGELLPSARYESWSEDLRGRAAALHVDLLRLAGRWSDVIDLDPGDASAVRAVMSDALERGHGHRAVSVFEKHRRFLRDELGVEPDAGIAELHRSVCDTLVGRGETMVGRARELGVVDRLLSGDGRTPGHLFVVRGMPGIGKSALVRELARRARVLGRLVARASTDGTNDAYAVLANLLRGIVDACPGALDDLDEKTRSVLSTLIPVPGASPLELPLTRHQVVGAVQRLVRQAGHERGVALIVDDIDLADVPSLEALAVIGDGDVGDLLVVLTHRHPLAGSDVVERALARAARISPPATITLEGLHVDEATALVRTIAPGIDDDQMAAIVERAEGIPLFLVELAAVDDPGTRGTLEAVANGVAARFADLEPHEVGWLRRLAIVGGHLDLPTILAVTGCDDDDLDDLLDHALATAALVVDDGGYRFRHELVRATLAEQLPPHQRAAVHREAARRLAELHAGPARIAQHWIDGQRPEEAVTWLVTAADDAVRLGGYQAALDHLDRALALAAEHPGALRRRAQTLDALGDLRALAAYDAAVEAAEPAEAHELRPLQGLAQIKMGDPAGAVETVSGSHPRSLESQLAKALTMSGAALLGATGPELGTDLSAAGRRAALETGDPAAIVVAAWAQAAVAHARGELRESLWIDLAETAALPRLAVTVFDGQLCITQRLLYGNRPYDDVIAFTDAFLAEATRLGAARGIAFATTLRGEAELLSGRLDAADRDLREGARLHHELAAPTGEAFSVQRLAEVALADGRIDEARELIAAALEIARSSDTGFHLLDRIYGTRIQLAADPDAALAMVVEAEEAVRGPLETCPGCRITLEMPAAIAVARAGDLARLERYERSCTFLADVVMRLPAWDASLDELRGHRCLAHGDRDAARDHFGRAADRFRSVDQPIDATRCEQALASVGG